MRSFFITLLSGFLFCSCTKDGPSEVSADVYALNEMHETARRCFDLANACYSGNTSAVQNAIAESADNFPCRDMLIRLLEQKRFEETAYVLSLIWAQDLIMAHSSPRAAPQVAPLDDEEVELIESSEVMQKIKGSVLEHC